MQPDSETLHLMLVDGLNVVRRVYEANPAPDSKEKADAAVRSSLGSFRRALEEHKPTHVLAPFDYGGRTWRHELFADYRKKRKPMPQELRDVLPTLYDKLAAMGIATLSIAGVEADDVVAAVFFRWVEAKGLPVTILSTDKDLTALVAHGARVRDHFKPEWRDATWVQNKFFVSPDRMHDLLALMGDSSDDVPGVPGVAVKTAAKLLNEYGSLDGVLQAAGSIKGKLGENLRTSVELVRLSRKLVDFKTDMTLGLTWNALRYKPG